MQTRSDSESPARSYTRDAATSVFVPVGAPPDIGYSDGDALEEALLALMRTAADRSLQSSELEAHAVDWPTRYHLSAGRANLLRPIANLLRGRTLEVGAGCGVLTRYLGELGGQVVALEGSRRRADITAARCAGLGNVSVFHDRLERFVPDRPFSAVTLVGVLEWASRFVEGDEPTRRLLDCSARLLDDDGVLVVAIENQLGLKYLAGWPEDHVGLGMYGVNDLYRAGEPRTFGLHELMALMAGCGLVHQAVYASLPDYKFPRLVVSPAGLDDRGWSADLAAIAAATPVADLQDPVLPLLSQEQLLSLAARNGLLRDLTNSFLLVSARTPASLGQERGVLAWHFTGHRRLPFLRETRFLRRGRQLEVEHRSMAVHGAAGPSETDDSIRNVGRVDAFVPGEVWTSRLGGILNRPGWTIAEVAAWAAPWRDALARAAGLRRPSGAAHVPSHLVDATPFNLAHADGEFRFFDLEWEPSWRVEFGHVLFRGLYWSLSRFRSVAAPADELPLTIASLASQVAEALGTPISASDESRYLDLEADVQQLTTGALVDACREQLKGLRLQPRPSLESLARLESRAASLADHNRQLTETRDALEEAVNTLQVQLREAAERSDADVKALQVQLREAVERSDALDADVTSLHAEIRERTGQIATQRAKFEAQAKLAQAELHEAVNRSSAVRAALERRVTDAADARAALEREQLRLELSHRALEAQLAASHEREQTALARLRTVAAEREATGQRLSRAEDQLAQRRAEIDAAVDARRALARLNRAQQRMLQRTRQAYEVFGSELRSRTASLAAASATQPRPARPLGRLRQRLADAHLPLKWAAQHPLRFARGLVRLRHSEYRRQLSQLAESGLFDPAYYRALTGAGPEVDLPARFLLSGDAANESPHPLFDPMWYREHNPDLPESAPPLLHYLRSGGHERRDPHPLFDTRHYLSQWPADGAPAPTPLTHFLRVGHLGAASPHPLFDVRHYLEQRPDLPSLGVNPLLHYLANAVRDLTDPHPLFSTRFYLEHTPDIGSMNPLEHFVRHGATEDRSPHPLFDVGFYWDQRPDVRRLGVNPLMHFVKCGLSEHINPHPLFDTAFYIDQAEGLHETGMNPLVHFLRWGWRDGLRPNPWFDPSWYLAQNPDLAQANPLIHFVVHGWREGRDPSPEFSLSDYRANNPDVVEAGENPLIHYLAYGRSERRGVGSKPARTRQVSIHFDVAGQAHTARTIVCVGHVSPWPVSAGNQYALSRLLHHLQGQGYRIVLVLAPIPSEPLAPGALDELSAQFGNVVVCEPSGKVEFRLRDVPDVLTSLGAGLDGQTVWAEPGPDLDYCHDALVAVVRRLVETLGPTAILAQYIFMTRVFPLLGPHTLRIVHTHDVFSQKASNVLAYGINDVQISEAEEARLLNRGDVIMAVTEEDAQVLRRLAPAREVVLNQVDAEVRFDGGWPARPVAFLPASGNHLNVSGLRDFLKFSWPRIRAAVSDAELRIAGGVGRTVPPGTPGVLTLGRVPDLGDEYAAARVVINPAVAGTGLKIKSVEALAHLRPVVGWPHNRDGLPAALSRFVDEAADWQAFADAVIERLGHHESPFDEPARRQVCAALSPERAYGELERRLQRFFDQPLPQREEGV